MCDLYIRIHEECEKRGILDAQLCSALRYPASTLSDLKNGKKKTLSQEKLVAIAEYLNVSIDYLVTGKKEKPVTESDELEKYIDMLRTRPEMRLLLDTQDGTTKEQVEENVRFLDALRKAKNAD